MVWFILWDALYPTLYLLSFYFTALTSSKFQDLFKGMVRKFIGPLLILIGLFMLDMIRINFPGLTSLTEKFSKKGVGSYWGVLLLGIIFALAFCPYSGVLYFGMLMPLTISSSEGITSSVVFAVATGIPVIIFAWLIAYTLSGVGGFITK